MATAPVNHPVRVGVIADTHGLLRPVILKIFEGVTRIIHAGDVCGEHVLQKLATIAPVTAVRGNMDHTRHPELPLTQMVSIAKTLFYTVHDLYDLDIDPAAAGVKAVIHGHTHHPAMEDRNGVLFVNPGSAGPQRRPHIAPSVGLLEIHDQTVQARLIELF